MDDQHLEKLCALPLFRAVPRETLALLAGRMAHRRFAQGEVLLSEGEAGDELYVLLRGELRISKRTKEGEPYTMALVSEADDPVFGEFAMLDRERRSATVTAERAGELLVLRREDFEAFASEHPAAGLEIMRQLARGLVAELRLANENTVLLFEALVSEVRAKEVS